MTRPMHDYEMDSLFAAWSADRLKATPLPLKEWLAQYPDCAETLTQWAADARVMDFAEAQGEEAKADARALALGRQVLTDLRARMAPSVEVRRIASLKEAAQAVGLNLKALETRIGLGRSVMMKLEYRQIRAASVPAVCVERLAEALRVRIEEIRTYLNQSPRLAPGASYKSPNGVPEVGTQEDFAEAIRACSDMTEARKSEWLAED
jgi:hypothetical protein